MYPNPTVISTFKQTYKSNGKATSRILVFDCTTEDTARSLIDSLLERSLAITREASWEFDEGACKTMVIRNDKGDATLTFESPDVISEETWSVVYKASMYDFPNGKWKCKFGKRDVNAVAKEYAKR